MAADCAVLKILVLGNAATGKSSIIKRFVSNLFDSHHESTVGVDFSLKKIRVDGQPVKLQLWDIAGQERFGSIARAYYQNAYGAMLVYDASSEETFEDTIKVCTARRPHASARPAVAQPLDSRTARSHSRVSQWKNELDSKVCLPNGKPLPILLVGNKSDLPSAEYDSEFLNEFCEEHNFISWIDTSAKTGKNVKKAATTLVRSILAHEDLFGDDAPREREDTIRLGGDGGAEAGHRGAGGGGAAGGGDGGGCC
eukprot:PLAT11078.2.p1 GENE.PLAT11078.2~~PLAT11078.2.p1  ORF type:complete len:254 (+),score=92.07 PLAT11078.2:14-775(+)